MKGKYKCAQIIAGFLTLCLCVSCAGAADWTSEKLAGDFAVVRSNAETVQLCIMEAEDMTVSAPVIEDCVTEVAYNEDCILVKCRKPVEGIRQWRNFFQRQFYMVDVKAETLEGPYTKTEFENICAEKEIPNLNWQSVDSLDRVSGL